MSEEHASVASESTSLEPVDLVIREPIGELLLTIEADKLVLTPSKAFVHSIAQRMGQAEAAVSGRVGMVDRWVARSRIVAESSLGKFFGEFPAADCDVQLRDSRLHVRVGKMKTSFGPQSFDSKKAESFVRQFERARAICIRALLVDGWRRTRELHDIYFPVRQVHLFAEAWP